MNNNDSIIKVCKIHICVHFWTYTVSDTLIFVSILDLLHMQRCVQHKFSICVHYMYIYNIASNHVNLFFIISGWWFSFLSSLLPGNMAPNKRQSLWESRRVFFLTPQVLQNDLNRGSCKAEQIVLLVADEAHKALGNHAYCQVKNILHV